MTTTACSISTFPGVRQPGAAIQGNSLYRNNGDGTFTDMIAAAHVDDNTNTWAAVWGDYDNDGFLDLFVARPGTTWIGVGNANILYHNNGDGTFTDVAAQEGVALQDDLITSAHKLAAWGDYNDDGYLDLVVKDGISPGLVTGDAFKGLHYLFKNNGNTNHYIKLNLQGVQSNLRWHRRARDRSFTTAESPSARTMAAAAANGRRKETDRCISGLAPRQRPPLESRGPADSSTSVPDVAANTSLTVTEGSFPPPVQSQNISTRLDVETGDNVGIGGFIITGVTGTTKEVLIRGSAHHWPTSGSQDFLARSGP